MKDFIVEGRALDTQQMECVTEMSHNHLVVAGAGTGKTTTIIGKLKWLLKNGEYKPSEILVLSFTNASAAEMRERISAETGEKITAWTFHKLGLEIIKKVEPRTTIASEASQKFEDFSKKEYEVGFDDMITLSTEFVKAGRYKNPYKFVIVDEYQDISLPRFELLRALRESGDFDLFCVGDDWQAIYGFAGSEVDLILNFEKYWGETKLSKIETTYRFPQTLADVSGKFVMENFAQITKKIKALPDSIGPILSPDGEPRKNMFGKIKTGPDFAVVEVSADSNIQTLRFVTKKLSELPENASVYFLGRYTRDIDLLRYLDGLKRLDNDELAGIPFELEARKDLKIRFLTVHKSKGLQADFVFILNMKGGKSGFPSKKPSQHTEREKFPLAEERRLFYVALTRAKKKVFLLTVHGHKSEFVLELEDLFYKKMPIVDLGILSD